MTLESSSNRLRSSMKTTLLFFLVFSSSLGVVCSALAQDTPVKEAEVAMEATKTIRRSLTGGSAQSSRIYVPADKNSTDLEIHGVDEEIDSSARAMLSSELHKITKDAKIIKRVPRSYSGGSASVSKQPIVID